MLLFFVSMVFIWAISIFMISKKERAGLVVGLVAAVVAAIYALIIGHQSLLIGALLFGTLYSVGLYQFTEWERRSHDDS